MKIEVVGDGCALCSKLYENVVEALRLGEKQADVSKTMDVQKIAEHQLKAMPALVIDGVVKVSGKVPKVAEIMDWIK